MKRTVKIIIEDEISETQTVRYTLSHENKVSLTVSRARYLLHGFGDVPHTRDAFNATKIEVIRRRWNGRPDWVKVTKDKSK